MAVLEPGAAARSSLFLWALRVAGGVVLFVAVRAARWNGPRSPGLPASDLFVLLIGALVLGAIVATSFGLRRRRASKTAELPVGVGATIDGASSLVIAGVVGAIYLFATLDFPMN